jgi:uncharacterized protein (DUF3084 family)
MGGPGGPVSAGPGSGAPSTTQHRERIRATEQDRLRIHDSRATSGRVRNRAREMREAAEGNAFGAAQARQHRDQIRSEFQALEQRHGEFVTGLAPAERDRIRDRLRDMDRIRERTRDRLREMDAECDKAVPDRVRLQEQAQEVAREMTRLRTQYRDLDVE